MEYSEVKTCPKLSIAFQNSLWNLDFVTLPSSLPLALVFSTYSVLNIFFFLTVLSQKFTEKFILLNSLYMLQGTLMVTKIKWNQYKTK